MQSFGGVSSTTKFANITLRVVHILYIDNPLNSRSVARREAKAQLPN